MFLSDIVYFTYDKLSNIEFNSGDIAKIISGATPQKPYRHMISVPMLKICGKFICKPLEYIFRASSNNKVFLHNGKRLM